MKQPDNADELIPVGRKHGRVRKPLGGSERVGLVRDESITIVDYRTRVDGGP
jgi:hypothetical protein